MYTGRWTEAELTVKGVMLMVNLILAVINMVATIIDVILKLKNDRKK